MRQKIISILLALFSRVSLATAQRFGHSVGWLLGQFPNREREISSINITTCFPELSADEQQRLVKSALIESAKTLAEMPGIWTGQHQQWIDNVVPGVGGGLLEKAIAEGKGVIVIGPHQGNWEIALQYLSSLAKVTSPYRAPKLDFLDGLIKQGRGAGGATLVEATPKGVKALFGALRRGEVVAMLADQQPKAAGKHGSVFAPFFGYPALTGVLASRLAYKTNASVLFWFVERLPDAKGYRGNWFSAPEGVADAEPVVAATAMNAGLELCVRQCPEQYLWSYKRFDRQPNGSLSPYKIN